MRKSDEWKIVYEYFIIRCLYEEYESLTRGDKKSTIKAGKGDELLNFQGLEF